MESAASADHAVKQEPVNVYGWRYREGVDGLMVREYGPEKQQATGLVHSATEGRVAFDVLTCFDVSRAKWRVADKRRRYADAIQAEGDTFFAPCFSPFGVPYSSALALLGRVAHTGDAVPADAGRDVPRFNHEAATWATPSHMTFAVHAAAIAAAKSVTSATQDYCRRRMIDSYLVDAIENAPLPVLRPN